MEAENFGTSYRVEVLWQKRRFNWARRPITSKKPCRVDQACKQCAGMTQSLSQGDAWHSSRGVPLESRSASALMPTPTKIENAFSSGEIWCNTWTVLPNFGFNKEGHIWRFLRMFWLLFSFEALGLLKSRPLLAFREKCSFEKIDWCWKAVSANCESNGSFFAAGGVRFFKLWKLLNALLSHAFSYKTISNRGSWAFLSI